MSEDPGPTRGQILFVISGPSGSGKATVLEAMVERIPALSRIVTYTTRRMRPGEVDGQDYRFVSEEQFSKLQAEGEIFESESVYGLHRYGSPRHAVRGTGSGDLIVELDPQGFLRLRQARTAPTVGIFLLATPTALRKRIEARALESDLEKRLLTAREQLASAPAYDYLVVNEDRARCVSDVETIVRAERLRAQGPLELSRLRRDFGA